MYIWHFVSVTHGNNILTTMSSLKKYGLLSPAEIWKESRNMFNEIIVPIYRSRAQAYYKKKYTVDLDILNYLNSSLWKPTTSKSLYFSFCPYNNLSKSIQLRLGNVIEIKIDSTKINKPPIIINKDKVFIGNSNDFNNARREAMIKSKQEIGPRDFAFEHIPHVAYNIGKIKDFESIKYLDPTHSY